MWRLTALTMRKPGLSAEEFAGRSSQTLAPAIVASPAARAGLRRLVLNRALAQRDPGSAAISPPRFDGLVEFWFDGPEDALAVMNGLSGDERLLESAADVLDGTRGVAWLAEVFPKKPESGMPRIKSLAGGDQADGWTVAAAQKYWSETHPRVAQTAPLVWEPLTRYVQFHGREVAGLRIGSWLAAPRFVPMCAEMG